MGLDLSLSGFIGAGGGLAYVLVGLLVAASHGRPRLRLLLAGLLGSQGLSYAMMSLTTPEATGPATPAAIIGVALVLVFGGLTFVFAAALAIQLARETSRGAMWTVGGALGLLGVMGAVFLARGGITPGKGDPAAMPPEVHLIYAVVLIGYAACAVAVLAMALHWKTHAWSATSVIAVAVALVPLPSLTSSAARSTPEALLAAFAVACVLAWGPPWRDRDPRVGRNVLLGLLAWALSISLLRLVPQFSDFGGNSLAPFEVVSALALALALVKRRAWGLQPPRFVLRRGPLTAAALAMLFVVAQVGQNVLQSQYGLLMGGVAAGALLFAANPIQRAIERLGDHTPGRPTTGNARRPRDAAQDAEREGAYREAVRLALRDRTLTREEERHLLRLAYQLGVPTPRAMEIHDEVERRVAGGRT